MGKRIEEVKKILREYFNLHELDEPAADRMTEEICQLFEQDGIKQIRPARLEPKPDESRLLGWWQGFWKRVGIK